MPENNLDKLNLPELWAFIVVIISGAIGGCSAAFTNRSNEKRLITLITLCGYTITGIFGALVAFAFLSSMTDDFFGQIETIVFWSCITGFSTSIGLAGTNASFKMVLNKLGIELEINVRRSKKRPPSD